MHIEVVRNVNAAHVFGSWLGPLTADTTGLHDFWDQVQATGNTTESYRLEAHNALLIDRLLFPPNPEAWNEEDFRYSPQVESNLQVDTTYIYVPDLGSDGCADMFEDGNGEC